MGDLTIRCSNCEGLAKEIDSSRPFFVCKFCGAPNKNPLYESRHQQQQRRQAEAMAQTNAALSLQRQIWAVFRWWIAIPFVVLTLLGAGMSVFLYRPTVPGSTAHDPVVSSKPVFWLWINSHRAFPLQADDDGVEDVALLTREEVRLRGTVQRQGAYLAVYSGKSLKPLWRVETKKNVRLWRAPGKLLIVRAQHLRVYDEKKGKLLWKGSLPDKIDNLGLVDGQLRVRTKTKAWSGFDVETGEAQGKVKEPRFTLCRDWYFFQKIRDTHHGDIRRPRRYKGYTVHATYCPVTKQTKYRHNGHKLHWADHRTFCHTPHGLAEVSPSKGTRVPSFLGYERKSQEMRWIRKLTNELKTFEKPPQAALDETEALVTYKIAKAPRRLELFDLVDGKVRWAKAMKRSRWGDEPRGLGLGAQRAYVIHRGYSGVQIFDRRSGKVVGWIRGDKR